MSVNFITLFSATSCSQGNLRLVGGSNHGRVEICINGVWGTVCDSYWDSNDARVVCRQLGFRSGRNVALGNSCWFLSIFIVIYLVTSVFYGGYFGQGTGPLILYSLGCTGTESSLLRCSHSIVGVATCSHSNDAGVVCSSCKLYM